LTFLIFNKINYFFKNLTFFSFILHEAAVYLPPKHNIKNSQFADYFNSFNNNFIIGADFNAKHQSWGCRVNNPRWVTLYNYINTKRFKVLVPPDPTYWPSSTRKNPDILDIFVSNLPNTLFHSIKNLKTYSI